MPRRNRHSGRGHEQIFAVRYKLNGSFLTRHFPANSQEQAALRAPDGAKILGTKKVHPEQIIGDIKSMHLNDIIGIGRRQPDVILNEATLDSIIFPNIISRRNRGKNKHRKRRFNNGNRF